MAANVRRLQKSAINQNQAITNITSFFVILPSSESHKVLNFIIPTNKQSNHKKTFEARLLVQTAVI